MHLSNSIITLVGALFFISETLATPNQYQGLHTVSEFDQLPKSTVYLQSNGLQPASYAYSGAGFRKLYSKRRFDKIRINNNRNVLYKREDYAATIALLKAAIESYKMSMAAASAEPVPAADEEIPDLTSSDPPIPDLGAADTLSTEPPTELGNKSTEAPPNPIAADIEEDDVFDPEEDPDDVDDPAVVNGVAVEREE